MTRRYILTGAPGAGKTALIRHLASLGQEVVEEAATDVITEAHGQGIERPWERPGFITDIAGLQASREAALTRSARRFSDRSPYCTLALAEWLGYPIPPSLLMQADDLIRTGWFERQVFFIDQLGFIENTHARQISFADAKRFGAVHETVYRHYGFEIIHIRAAPVPERARTLLDLCC